MAERTVQSATAAGALAEVAGDERPEGAERRRPFQIVVEIVARFCDELGPDLVDPMTRKRIDRCEAQQAGAPLDLIDSGSLVRLLAPCARIFPYQVVANATVLDAFQREVPRLAERLTARKLCTASDVEIFEAGWSRARSDLARHHELQLQIEEVISPFVAPAGDVSLGHYRVEGVTGSGVTLRAGDDIVAPVLFPALSRPLFGRGLNVSVALERQPLGWFPLATSLPLSDEKLTELIDEGRRFFRKELS